MERRTFIVAGGALARRAFGANDRSTLPSWACVAGGATTSPVTSSFPARIGRCATSNQAQTERGSADVEKLPAQKPKAYQDMRKLFDDKESTPSPCHAEPLARAGHHLGLPGGQGCVLREAGQPQHLRRPARWSRPRASTTAWCRSACRAAAWRTSSKAMELLRDGAIGKVYMAKGLCFKRRPSIGHTPDEPVPPGLDWDMFLGPAPMRAVHQEPLPLQLALVLGHRQRRYRQPGHPRDGHRALGAGRGLPQGVVSTGGKYVYDDDQETPNTQIATSITATPN